MTVSMQLKENKKQGDRMNQLSNCRLQRQSFLDTERKLRNQHNDLINAILSYIHSTIPVPLCQNYFILNINCSIPGIKEKDLQTREERNWYLVLNAHLNINFPKESWTRVYTDGSTEDSRKMEELEYNISSIPTEI